jgi:D-sedoheptulose 7-phosphate isomerase
VSAGTVRPEATPGPAGTRLDELAERRRSANATYFDRESERIARLCHRMAERFARGGRLLSLGSSPAARSDARHVAVEFVHPVIVGKRALPALGLAPEGGDLVLQIEAVAEPDDIVFAYADAESASGPTAAAIAAARRRGCLSVAFRPGTEAEWSFEPADRDPFIAQEVTETHYHLLWELVHVFFEHRGLLAGRQARPTHDPGNSSFLYPFLSEGETDAEAVIADVRESVLIKAREVGELREQTLGDNAGTLVEAAAALRGRFEAGATLLAFGNGGSATDAMDVVADFRDPPGASGWPARAAIDLTEDPAILTAIANDIGVEEIFQRQVIAYGREGDAAIAISTSGDSLNIVEALAEARRRGLLTIALVGYDGGRIAADGLADHVVVTRSQHIPRIQEAQAAAYHALRELVELEPAGP